MSKLEKISFVIPCYNSENLIENVVASVEEKMLERAEFDYEIILVNDASPDNVLSVIKKIADENFKITVMDLAKNRGKHAAIMAGYTICTGDIVVNLDDDGQCPIEHLWELIEPLYVESYDISIAAYGKKKQSRFKNFGSYVNELMLRWLLEKPKELEITNFWAFKRFVGEEMIRCQNPYPYVIGLYLRTTNKIINVPMEEHERQEGVSGYTFRKSFSLLMNGFTAFSVKPLRVASVLGIIIATIGFLYTMFIIVSKILNPDILLGYSSLMSAILVVGGIIMMLLGIIGEYVGRIYISINKSPQYVIREVYSKEKEE